MRLIELKGVTKEYNGVPILQDASLVIEEGELVSVIGPSGSGKTTLLNLLTGFVEPTRGEALYYSKITQEPKRINENLHKIKNHIGFTSQHNSFYHKLTVKENLLHFGKMYGVPQETLVNNIKSLLQFTNLYDERNKLAEHLSGGMQKRLDISCSLVHKPKMLVLDEPTAELDPLHQAEVLTLLQEVNQQGVTVIIASNQLEMVEKISHKVVLINKGRIRLHGSLEEVRRPFFRDHFTINLRQVKNSPALMDSLRKLPVSRIVQDGNTLVVYPKNVEETLRRLLQIIKEENLYLHDLDLHQPELSEIFERVVSE